MTGSSMYGMYLDGFNFPILEECRILDNELAGIYINSYEAETPLLLSGCTLAGNRGMAVNSNPNITIENTGNTVTGNGGNFILLRGGSLKRNNTLRCDGQIAYLIDGAVVIGDSVSRPTLTIEPGVKICFKPGSSLTVGAGSAYSLSQPGALQANGTQSAKIVFSSWSDQPVPGDWDGLIFSNYTMDDRTSLQHCIIEYGGGGNRAAAAYVDRAAFPIAYCTVQYSSTAGLFYAYGSTPVLKNSLLANNGGAGVSLAANSSVILQNSFLHNQTGIAVRTSAAGHMIRENHFSGNALAIDNSLSANSVLVNAEQNYWGHPSGPFDPSDDTAAGGWYNPGGQGDPVSDLVAYEPWQRLPGQQPVMLAPGVLQTIPVKTAGYDFFTFPAAAGRCLVIRVTPLAPIDSLLLSEQVTRQQTTTATIRNTYELMINPTQAVIYNFQLYYSCPQTAGGQYTILAEYPAQAGGGSYLSDLQPRQAANLGFVTMRLSGNFLTSHPRVKLQHSSLPEITPEDIQVRSQAELYATFNLEGVPVGVYDMLLEDETGEITLLEGAFTINAYGNSASLSIEVEPPQYVRINRQYAVNVCYSNTGDTNLPAPLLTISNDVQAPMQLDRKGEFTRGPLQLLAIGSPGLPDRILPGAQHTLSVYAGIPGHLAGHSKINFTVNELLPDSTPLNWNSLENNLRPKELEADAWEVIWQRFIQSIGLNQADYVQRLRSIAMYLSRYRKVENRFLASGQLEQEDTIDTALYDVQALLRFDWHRAQGRFFPDQALAASMDAAVSVPGLPLVLTRTAGQTLADRFYLGPFGRGWRHRYEVKAYPDSAGNVEIAQPGSFSGRLFTRQPDGSFQSAAGDKAGLTYINGCYLLQEPGGLLSTFDDVDGSLLRQEDANGNALTFTYNGGRLMHLSHSCGEMIKLSYNSQGRIAEVVFGDGKINNYSYDASGQYLTHVVMAGGINSAYDYHPADGSPAAHALTTITLPGGNRYYYGYDNQGRIISSAGEDGQELLSYAYDEWGGVQVTDSAGSTTTLFYGIDGELMQAEDAAGNRLEYSYTTAGTLAACGPPAAANPAVAYNDAGQPVAVCSAPGRLTRLVYAPGTNNLLQITGPLDRTTELDYDSNGNLIRITGAAQTTEQFVYDAAGSLSGYTNRRAADILYTRNSRGQITRKEYPDGRIITYDYDQGGNLLQADDSLTGRITLAYDHRNLLTAVDYPDGFGFQYEYDQAGRRIRRTARDGSSLSYIYNAAGLLAGLEDQAGLSLVTYEYDTCGRLIVETKGNGTSAVYTYNATGQLSRLVNREPGGGVQSFFNYTYNADGSCATMTTEEGATAYGYNEAGELTSVTYPDGSSTVCSYDAAGNRYSMIRDGVTESYTVDAVNRYTQAGDTVCTYDADGNLLSRTDTKGTTAFTWDAENRLTRLTQPDGIIREFSYDALGNRFAESSQSGVKRYVYDPVDSKTVVAEYDGSGTLLARYTRGLGLTARTDSMGMAAFYAFDGSGNTREITDYNGLVCNSYDYDVFGETTTVLKQLDNVYAWGGRNGFSDEGYGLALRDAILYDRVLQTPLNPQGGLPGGLYASIILPGLNLPEKLFYAGFGNSDIYSSDKGFFEAGGPLFGMIELMDPTGIIHNFGRMHDALMDFIGEHCGKVVWWLANFPTMRPVFQQAVMQFLIDAAVNFSFEKMINRYYDEQNFFRYAKSWWDEKITDWSERFWDWWYGNSREKDSAATEVLRPHDPNAKAGPPGVTEAGCLPAGEIMEYTVFFENKATASAPAQEVFIYDYLAQTLDWSTFSLKQAAFGDQLIAMLPGQKIFSQQLPYRGLLVELEAKYFPESGLAGWIFRSPDPETGELPEDALAGFLPPEDGTGCGQGWVSFCIRSKIGLAAGTTITNTATILFDTESALVTNPVTNTIADPPPAAAGGPIPANGAENVFITPHLGWSHAARALEYDLYLWPAAEVRPPQPTLSGLVEPQAEIINSLSYGMEYGDQLKTIYQDTGLDNSVDYSTTHLTMRIEDSQGNGLPGALLGYANPVWQLPGITGADGELSAELLVPAKFKFSALYNGVYCEKYQDITIDNLVAFTTTATTVLVTDNSGNPLPDAVVMVYSVETPLVIGITDTEGQVTAEILAGQYRFGVQYGGVEKTWYQDLRLNNLVCFFF